MIFTDDDLKRLKEKFSYPVLRKDVKADVMQALLARLEAAEAVIDAQSHTEHCVDEFLRNGCTCHFQKAIDAWRKSAGRK